jgi:hypothetical protein
MELNNLGYNLENGEIESIIEQENYISNQDEIPAGTNDIIDRRTHMPGDEEIVNKIADDIGLADYSPADDVVAQFINAYDYNEELLDKAEKKQAEDTT